MSESNQIFQVIKVTFELRRSQEKFDHYTASEGNIGGLMKGMRPFRKKGLSKVMEAHKG
jgi:hypothetical protein